MNVQNDQSEFHNLRKERSKYHPYINIKINESSLKLYQEEQKASKIIKLRIIMLVKLKSENSFSVRELANEIQCTHTSILKWLKLYKIGFDALIKDRRTGNKKGKQSKNSVKISQELQKGLTVPVTIAQIARKLNLKYNGVYKCIQRDPELSRYADQIKQVVRKAAKENVKVPISKKPTDIVIKQ